MSDDTPSKADDSTEEPVVEPTLVPADALDHEPVSESLADATSDPVATRDPLVVTGPAVTDPEATEPLADPSNETGPVLVEPQESPAPETAEFRAAVAEPVVAEPVVAEPVVVEHNPEPVIVPTAVAAASAVPAQQMVYVQPELPPKKRGNRLIGTLLSIVGAALFAGLYAVVSAFILDLREGDLFGSDFISFLGSAFFWVPVAVFLVGLILLVLVLNRAGWWAHVFGSLILAIAVYFATILVLLLVGNVFHGSPTVVTFAALAVNPWVIAAAVAAREISIWTGLGIAARGRRVKVRNVEARAAFDREQEAKKAEYAATGPVAGY